MKDDPWDEDIEKVRARAARRWFFVLSLTATSVVAFIIMSIVGLLTGRIG